MQLLQGTLSPLVFSSKSISDPADIANLRLWTQADMGTWQDLAMTVPATADVDRVSVWADLSGNNNHLVQGIDAIRPEISTDRLNSKKQVFFNGTSYFFDITNALTMNDYTTFFVGFIAEGSPFVFGGNNDTHLCNSTTNGALGAYNYNGVYETVATTYPNNQHSIQTAKRESGIHTYRQNGIDASTNVFNTTTATIRYVAKRVIDVGNQYLGRSVIGTVMIYDRALSITEIQIVERYLSQIYGISVP